jgi:desulfoferrodoxin-like iron-binding protein
VKIVGTATMRFQIKFCYGGEHKMTKKGEVYVCEICGNKVKVLEEGGGTLVCCGQDMTLVS